ncbi:MAG: hypothetical protein U0841_10730 [Chloroflexia bacterium]
MSQAPAQLSEIRRKEYRARATQFLAGLTIPPPPKTRSSPTTPVATPPWELREDTLTLPNGTFDTAAAFTAAIVATHLKRQPHTWTSREMRD